jgi:hypothetical protein
MSDRISLNPTLHPETYVFCELPNESPIPVDAVAAFRETEGLTVVIEKEKAVNLGYQAVFESAWITIGAETSLTDLGITAKFATVLSENGISCNVFAAVNHDHIFVPWADREKTMELLEK